MTALEVAEGDDQVEFTDAKPGESGSFLAEGRDERCTERESDDDADWDACAIELGNSIGSPDGVDHGAGEAVADGFGAEGAHLGVGGVGLEEGVVDDGGEGLPRGQRVGGKVAGVPTSIVEFEVR
jgi:hypothetical protein